MTKKERKGREEQEKYKANRKKMNKMAIVTPCLSLMTLHVNG